MGCANSELRSTCKAADLRLNDETGTTDLFNLKNVNVRSAPHNQWIANQVQVLVLVNKLYPLVAL